MNDTLLFIFLSCLALGTVVGFLSGLLGIGGGLIIVPALVYLLPYFNVTQLAVMPMALATSLATIVITATSAAFAHRKNGNIPWPIAKMMMVFVAAGALSGAFIADKLSNDNLTVIFSTAVILLALYMLRSIHKPKQRALPNNRVLKLLGLFTGVLASLMGISGGAVLIPSLTYFGMPLRHTIGVATVCGMTVALFGSIGYVITGLQQSHLPPWSFGYIYLPALLGLITSSSLLAKYGVAVATKLPVKTLKKFFALFLILVAIKMMLV
ncbi:MAG: hypothetical protein COB35_01160 [Gammaproteobacteria bacterium]|nr:MAG: hypothetical protein COB35_01160 [Gammaproteobacteria bacterium]